ncbi:hypothetical protein LJC10_03855 [Selenomonadales bacterium OttesenSCG-928-I06]|nr:hypothetical protein [Selenomonadales bacterium OttesenSCG-928-I06]
MSRSFRAGVLVGGILTLTIGAVIEAKKHGYNPFENLTKEDLLDNTADFMHKARLIKRRFTKASRF